MELKVLGCGDAFASEGRFNTSFLLLEGDEMVLVDCGASTLIRLKQERIAVDQISRVIITHFHGDHYGGLPFFIICRYVELKCKEPFTIAGPAGIRDKVYQLQEALYPGSAYMIDEIGVRFVELQDRQQVDIGDMTVYARKVKHAPPSNPHGVRLSWKEKVFAFSGDTEWTDALLDLADGSDLFICECNFLEDDGPGHLGYRTIRSKMDQFNTERIYLTHMGTEVITAHEFETVRLVDGMEFVI